MKQIGLANKSFGQGNMRAEYIDEARILDKITPMNDYRKALSFELQERRIKKREVTRYIKRRRNYYKRKHKKYDTRQE